MAETRCSYSMPLSRSVSIAMFTALLMWVSDSGGIARSASAHALASSMRRPASATALTMPQSSAFAASTNSPNSIICLARAGPTSRGNRCVPPAPGSMPSVTSGSAIRAETSAMRRSQASANSSPPPAAAPLIAAMVTWPNRSSRRNVGEITDAVR